MTSRRTTIITTATSAANSEAPPSRAAVPYLPISSPCQFTTNSYALALVRTTTKSPNMHVSSGDLGVSGKRGRISMRITGRCGRRHHYLVVGMFLCVLSFCTGTSIFLAIRHCLIQTNQRQGQNTAACLSYIYTTVVWRHVFPSWKRFIIKKVGRVIM